MSFWTKLKALIALFGAGGEIALIIGESAHSYKLVVGVATLVGYLITMSIEDKDANGIVDLFEKRKRSTSSTHKAIKDEENKDKGQ